MERMQLSSQSHEDLRKVQTRTVEIDGQRGEFTPYESRNANELSGRIDELAAPEGQTVWPDVRPGEPIEDGQAYQMWAWRAGNVGHALDVVRHTIETDQDADQWLELKQIVAEVKVMAESAEMVEALIELEAVGWAFVRHHNIDMGAFQRVSNK